MNHSYLFLVSALVICSCTFDKKKNAENQPDNSEENASTLYDDQITSTALLNSFDTTITVLFWETTDSTSETQEKNLQQFINKQDSLFPSILNAIFEEYKQSYSAYKEGWTKTRRFSDIELEKYLPKPTTPDKLKAFITPGILHIQNKKDCKLGTIGIEFDCTWDIENGLGVMLENWKVVKTGVAEASYF